MIYVNIQRISDESRGICSMFQRKYIYMKADKLLTVILGNWNALQAFCQLHIHLQRFFMHVHHYILY